MITRTTTVDIKPTPREIANEIWEMSSGEQADLILALSHIYDIYMLKFQNLNMSKTMI